MVKMSSITESLSGLHKLELHKHNASGQDMEQDPLFFSWSADKFCKL